MTLNAAELQLEERLSRGEPCDVSSATSSDRPIVRGHVLSDLAHRLVRDGDTWGGIRLTGAAISGVLDLEFFDFARPLELKDCIFDEPPIFEQCCLRWLSLQNSTLPGLYAYQLRVDYDVVLGSKFTTTGDLLLPSATIGGNFELGPGISTEVRSPWTLDLSSARIGGELVVKAETASEAAVDPRRSIVLDNADIGGRLSVLGHYRDISMVNTAVHDNVEAFGVGVRPATSSVTAVNAQRSQIDGDLYIGPDVTADGAVVTVSIVQGLLNLAGAHVKGKVTLAAVWMVPEASDQVAVYANALRVDGDFELSGFSPNRTTSPDTAKLEEPVHSVVGGTLDLADAKFGGNVTFSHANITAGAGRAVDLTLATINSNLSLGMAYDPSTESTIPPDLVLNGGLALISAQVGGTAGFLSCSILAHKEYPDLADFDTFALEAELLHVEKGILWSPKRSVGIVDFSFADTLRLKDVSSSWPSNRCLVLQGLSYRELLADDDGDMAPRRRLEWLRRQHYFSPDSYDALRDHYLRHGDEAAAATISVAKYKARAAERGRFWSGVATVYDWIAGCGYRPVRSIVWLVSLWGLIGVILFLVSQFGGPIVPTNLATAATAERCDPTYPCFSSWRFSFETVIPLVGGEQLSAWRIETSTWSGTLLRLALTGASLGGLLFSTTAVGALTGLLRRD